MDVAAWLQDLGLERYVPAFRDNDIDAEVLRKVIAEDLSRPPAQAARRDCQPRHGGSRRRGDSARPWCTGTSRRRTPAAHRDVLRSGRLDGTLDAVRPGGFAGADRRLPPLR